MDNWTVGLNPLILLPKKVSIEISASMDTYGHRGQAESGFPADPQINLEPPSRGGAVQIETQIAHQLEC